MYFRLTRLTDDVYQLDFMDGSVSSGILLNAKEISLLEEVLEDFLSLGLSEEIDRWYNS